MKEGDKVVLIGTMLGRIIKSESAEIIKLGQGKESTGFGEVEVMKVRLECGDVVSVPACHVHLPS